MAEAGGKWSRRGESGWRRLIAAYPGSSETVADYCRRVGCCTASFYQWRRRLEEDRASPPTEDRTGDTGFVDLGPLTSSKRAGFKLNLTLEFSNGLKLHLVRP